MDVRQLHRSGILFIVSAPSGAGKTTLSTGALQRLTDIDVSVSCTTRSPRAGEIPGQHYAFLSRDEFERRRSGGAFAEWAEVHGFLYGTPKDPIDRALGEGRDMLLDIDVQGSRQMKERYPQAVGVFVLPPSEAELERRLRGRGTDAPEVIARRLERAKAEMAEYVHYDYWIVNQEVAASIDQLVSIVAAERSRVARLLPLPG